MTEIEEETTDAEVKAMVLHMAAKLMAEKALAYRWSDATSADKWLLGAAYARRLAEIWEKPE